MRLYVVILACSLSFACGSNDSPESSGSGGGAGTSGGAAGSSGAGAAGSSGAAGSAGATASGGSAGSAGTTAGGGSSGSGGTGGGSAPWACPAGPFEAPAAQGEPQQVTAVPPQDGFNPFNVEGPVWVDGALYVSEIKDVPSESNPPPSRILKVVGDTVTIAIPDSGTNGLAIDGNGALYGARHADGSISKFELQDPTSITPVVSTYESTRFNSPNDLAIRSDGNVYFSDPTWQAPTTGDLPDDTRVYRIAPGASVATVVDEGRNQPNGVTLSLDGNTLFVSDIDGLTKYAVNPDGSTEPGTPVAGAPGADGMGMDCAGNLYLTSGKQVVILSSAGAEIERISLNVSGDSLTNVAFGGPERKTLFVTYLGDSPGLWRVELNVPGMPY